MHTSTTLLKESEGKGKLVRGEKEGRPVRERQEGRKRRAGASPGELQTALTQHALCLQGLGDCELLLQDRHRTREQEGGGHTH